MNMQSNAVADFPLESRGIAPASIPLTRRVYWALRRELWESRSIYVAPLAAGALVLLGFLLSLIRLPGKMRDLSALDAMQQREAIAQPYDIAASLLMLTALSVAVFYCVDALYGERRDRSTLLWKSLPVSDRITVLTKASIPLLVLPLVAFAVTVVTQFIMLLLSSAVLAGSGQSVTTLWRQLSFFRMSLLLLYHLMTVHALSAAPFYGWLLLVSAWARRAPLVWAFVPPLALAYLEKITFNTTHFADLLQYGLAGSGMEAFTTPGTFPMDPMTQITPGRFLSAPSLWIGLVAFAIFLAAAVRLRRYQGPI